ncbi:hypothetical protein ID866_10957 [Astraeus odoratus]|nr:hypothetical protein ID866_10957 [Astraeus odoratus]
MAPIGKLYCHPLQAQTKPYILSAAAITGLEMELLPFKYNITNKSLDFVKKYLLGNVPAFQDKEGFTLFKVAAIPRYVSSLELESGLLGRGAKEASLAGQWVHFAKFKIQTTANIIYAGAVPKYLPISNRR